MKKKWLWALALPALGGVAAVVLSTTATQAADHLDGPRTEADPAADITDVYAFMSPATSGHAVFVMNVFPEAGASSKLSDKVAYNFRVRQVTGTNPVTLSGAMDITCQTTGGGASITCTAPGATPQTKTVAFNATSTCGSTDLICVYAGLRSDPFFFDLAGFKATVSANSPKFTGTNFFQGLNVISIVVELDVPTAFPGALAPTLTVAAETVRSQ